jgi:hypothetical protein
MKLSRKNNVFIALLLVTLTFNTYTMEPQEPNKIGWVALAGGVLIGGYAAYQQFLSYVHAEPFDFASQSPEMQNKIILFLTTNTTAKSLKEAAQTINSLAQTNKELNEWINDSEFCLKIIKHLAQKFNCSDQTAAKILQTQEAKRRLNIQTTLQELCTRNSTNEERDSLFEQGVILDFTYDNHTPPLTLAATNRRFDVVNNIIVLAFRNKLNLNFVNMSNEVGDTPLLICIRKTTEYNGLHYIGQRKKYIGTNSWPIYFSCLDNIKLLLEAGADPELANKNGLTPFAAAQQTGNQEVIDLIQNAIKKKHGI